MQVKIFIFFIMENQRDFEGLFHVICQVLLKKKDIKYVIFEADDDMSLKKTDISGSHHINRYYPQP